MIANFNPNEIEFSLDKDDLILNVFDTKSESSIEASIPESKLREMYPYEFKRTDGAGFYAPDYISEKLYAWKEEYLKEKRAWEIWEQCGLEYITAAWSKE